MCLQLHIVLNKEISIDQLLTTVVKMVWKQVVNIEEIRDNIKVHTGLCYWVIQIFTESGKILWV